MESKKTFDQKEYENLLDKMCDVLLESLDRKRVF